MNIDGRELDTVALKASFPGDLFYGKSPSFFLFRIRKKERKKRQRPF